MVAIDGINSILPFEQSEEKNIFFLYINPEIRLMMRKNQNSNWNMERFKLISCVYKYIFIYWKRDKSEICNFS